MSPVCRKCHNYILRFPCPHCGTAESFDNRTTEDIKPIVPTEIQAEFDEPPPPIANAKSVSDSAKEELNEPLITPPSSEPALRDSPAPSPPHAAKAFDSSIIPKKSPVRPPLDIPVAKTSDSSIVPQEAPTPHPPSAIKPSRRSLDFRSETVGAAAVAVIEDHLRKMQISIQRLENSVNAILQGQKGMQAILEEMRKEKEEGERERKEEEKEIKA